MKKKDTLRVLAVKHTWFDATRCVIPKVKRAIGMEVEIDALDDDSLFEERNLQIPITQKELLHCALILNAGDLYGITLRGKGFELAYTYMLFLYPNGGKVLDDRCNPCLDSIEALHTLKYLSELWQYTPPGVLNYSFPDIARAFTEGVAGLYHDASIGAILTHDCAIRERFGYALPPAGREIKTSVAGWGLGIPAAAPHEEEAFYYVNYP